MTNEQAAEFAATLKAELPAVLDDMVALGESVRTRLADLYTARTALPASAPAEVRHALALPILQIEFVCAVFDGAPTRKLQQLILDLERARKRAGKAG